MKSHVGFCMKFLISKHTFIQSVRRHIANPTFLMVILLVQPLLTEEVLAAGNVERRDAMEYFFHQSFNNLDEELEIAEEEGKSGVFIMFTDKDCPWCHKMKTTIMSRADVQDYYREYFRVLTIDINGDTSITDFEGNEMEEKEFAFKKHRVRATPVVMFFDNKGKKTMRLTGIVRDAREFLWLGEYVVNADYKRINFTRYKRQRAKQEKQEKQASLK